MNEYEQIIINNSVYEIDSINVFREHGTINSIYDVTYYILFGGKKHYIHFRYSEMQLKRFTSEIFNGINEEISYRFMRLFLNDYFDNAISINLGGKNYNFLSSSLVTDSILICNPNEYANNIINFQILGGMVNFKVKEE